MCRVFFTFSPWLGQLLTLAEKSELHGAEFVVVAFKDCALAMHREVSLLEVANDGRHQKVEIGGDDVCVMNGDSVFLQEVLNRLSYGGHACRRVDLSDEGLVVLQPIPLPLPAPRSSKTEPEPQKSTSPPPPCPAKEVVPELVAYFVGLENSYPSTHVAKDAKQVITKMATILGISEGQLRSGGVTGDLNFAQAAGEAVGFLEQLSKDFRRSPVGASARKTIEAVKTKVGSK